MSDGNGSFLFCCLFTDAFGVLATGFATEGVIGSHDSILHLEIGVVAGVAVSLYSNGVLVGLAGGNKRFYLLLKGSECNGLAVAEQGVLAAEAYLQHVAAVDVLHFLLWFVCRRQTSCQALVSIH